MSERGIPRAPLERIMRNAGAERVSEDAIEVLRDAAQDVADEIADEAIEKASSDGNTTVSRDDVRIASE